MASEKAGLLEVWRWLCGEAARASGLRAFGASTGRYKHGYRSHLALLSARPWGWAAVSEELAAPVRPAL